ncbi:hypothetical protein BDZ90DRAFT_193016 [Jaminaea rosea]|uniref:G-patch domain-containing protein n=1 Tax=Jaminaea rosea TaxID=1569628 RepID=A0A316UNH2_9BASI|nr:hypothetical protein BDZ90DRAFT_193016 [Jaminaea rosea]PWN26826.1 hypothetical protein BDZ90DRAFT_193016 [Jaminaea rosea]
MSSSSGRAGFSFSSNSSRASNGRPSSPLASNGRAPSGLSRRAFDEDDEDNDVDAHHGRSSHRGSGGSSRQELAGYGRAGAESRNRSDDRERGPRVIPLVKSNGAGDWREDRKRRLGLGQYKGDGTGTRTRSETTTDKAKGPERINDGEQKVGLQRMGGGRRDDQGEAEGSVAPLSRAEEERREMDALMRQAQGLEGDKTPPWPASSAMSMEVDEDDDDAAARRALMSNGFDSTSSNLNSGRTIPLAHSPPLDEEAAFRQDASTRPDAPTLEDYAATPVEDFGKALLRGMGWKEGQGAGKGGKGPTSSREVVKRSALLGLGAKERIPGGAGAAGGGASGAQGGRARQEQQHRGERYKAYKPLVRRDREESDDVRSNGGSSTPQRRLLQSSSSSSSRRSSRSPPPRHSRRDDRDDDRDESGRHHRHNDDDRRRRDRDDHNSRRSYRRDDDGRYDDRYREREAGRDRERERERSRR